MKPLGWVTMVAVAVAAYAAADFAHEGIGHGGACLALGGKVLSLSSTYEACSIRSPIIDGAGPVAGIVLALLFFLVLALRPPASRAARAFLCLGFAFAALWNVGYMIKSGIFDAGDWAFVIAGLKPAAAWHAGLAILGIVLYAAAMRVLASLIRRNLASADAAESAQTPFAFGALAYLVAGAAACAAAVFDPRGIQTVWNDAVPSAFGAIGLAWVGYQMSRRNPDLRLAVPASPAWSVIGLAAGILLIGVLGPGLRF